MRFLLLTLCLTLSFQSTLFAAIDVRKDILKPIATAGEFEDDARISFEVKEEARVGTDTHTDFQFTFAKGKMTFRLSVDAEAIKNPQFLVRDAALYGCLRYVGCLELPGLEVNYGGPLEMFGTKVSLYSVSELLDNVRAGNPSAKLRWARWKLEVLKRLTIKNEFEKQFPGTRAYLTALAKTETAAVAKLETEVKASEDAAALAQKQHYQLNREALERDLSELKTMLAMNDRKGVSRLLQALLPWKELQPAEATTWRRWISAIENPDRKNSVLAFRGVSNKEMLSADAGNGKYVFRSALLGRMRAGEDITVRLRGAREFYGDLERSQGVSSGELAVRIADQMYAHAEAMVPEKFGHSSIFMSFTPMLDVAEQFVSGSETMPGEVGGLLAVRLDSRRLISNLTGFNREIELLAPLVVFAEEVVHFQPGYRFSEETHQKFLDALKKRGENYHDDGSDIEKLDFQGRGFEFFRLMQSGR